ncbi:MAG: hypothetical protein ACK401_07675 [Archaeoglobaceae archaeon]
MEEEFTDRASLYLAMTLALMGFEEGIEFSRKIGADLTGCNKRDLKASVLREDYDPVTRSLLPKAISEFYERAGFEALDEPDSLVTMLAFMAQMARQDCMESIKIQHRFLRTHLIPTLSHAVEKCQGLKPFLEIVKEDADYLKRLLTTAFR